MAEEIGILHEFRDKYLLTNCWGVVEALLQGQATNSRVHNCACQPEANSEARAITRCGNEHHNHQW
jgi:hypothetical protein